MLNMALAGFGYTGKQKAPFIFLSSSPMGAEVTGMQSLSQLVVWVLLVAHRSSGLGGEGSSPLSQLLPAPEDRF